MFVLMNLVYFSRQILRIGKKVANTSLTLSILILCVVATPTFCVTKSCCRQKGCLLYLCNAVLHSILLSLSFSCSGSLLIPFFLLFCSSIYQTLPILSLGTAKCSLLVFLVRVSSSKFFFFSLVSTFSWKRESVKGYTESRNQCKK